MPIDLAPLFPKNKRHDEDERNAEALEWFMHYVGKKEHFDSMSWPNLKQSTVFHEKPSENLPKIPDSFYSRDYGKGYLNPPIYKNEEIKKKSIEKDLKSILKRWKLERENFPGWIILPNKSREKLQLWTQGSIIHFIITNIDELPWPNNLYLMFELNWRLEKALIPQYSECIECMIKILENYNPFNADTHIKDFARISECWAELAFALLRSAREDFEDSTFHYWQEKIDKVCDYKKEWQIRLYYEKCMFALYKLDFEGVRNILGAWPEYSGNLHWKIKKVGILIEIGDLTASLKLAEKLIQGVRSKQVSNKTDYYLLSLEGLLIYNLQILYTNKLNWEENDKYWDRLEELNLYKCNPRTEIEVLELKIKSQDPIIRESLEISMGFEPFRSQTTFHSNIGYLNFESVLPAFTLLRLLEEAGLPLNCPGVKLYSDVHINAARWISLYSTYRSISVLIRSVKKVEIERFFSRVLITAIESEKIQKLYPILRKAWDQSIIIVSTGSSKQISLHINSEFRYLEILSEIISRFCIRFSESQIEELFNLMVQLYKPSFIQGRNIVYQGIVKLFKRLLFTMPNQEILKRFSILLSLPLPVEDLAITIPELWPDPLDELDLSKYMEKLPDCFDRSTWEKPIDRLLKILKDGEPLAREYAFRRLKKISQIGGFNPGERARFSAALWSRLDKNGFPVYTGVMVKSNFIFLNCNNKYKLRDLLKKYLLNFKITVINKYPAVEIIDFLESIKRGTKPLFPNDDKNNVYIEWSEAEAVQIFKKLTALWKENCPKRKEENKLIQPFGHAFKRNLRSNLRKIPQILAEVIFPICKNKKDKKFIKEIEAFLHEMEDYGIPVNAAKPGLIFFEPEISNLIAGEIKKGIEALEDHVINESMDGLCNWLIYHYLDHSFPDVPGDLIDELIWIISLRKQPGLWYAIDYTSFIIKNMPEIITERQIENISRGIEYLIDETDPKIMKEKEQLHSKISIKTEEIPNYRSLASHLAFLLYNYFKNKHKTESKRMKNWKKALANDLLPEVRKIWDS